MTRSRVALYAHDGRIVQMMEASDVTVALTAMAADLNVIELPPEVTSLDFLRLDQTHEVRAGALALKN